MSEGTAGSRKKKSKEKALSDENGDEFASVKTMTSKEKAARSPVAQSDGDDGGHASAEDDDAFELANDNFLRSAQLQAKPPPANTALACHGFDVDWSAETRPVPRHKAKGDLDEAPVEELIKAAVADTWQKANAIQGQTVKTAVETAVKAAREEFVTEFAAARRSLEEQLQAEAFAAKTQVWEMAGRERDRAVQAAVDNQAAEIYRLKQAVLDEKAKRSQQYSQIYTAIREELHSEMQDEYETRQAAAVQTTWDRAAKQQERAMAAALEAARESLHKEADTRMAKERMDMRADTRRTVQEAEAAQEEAIRSCRDENKRLREQLKEATQQLRVARDESKQAEKRLAEEQMRAVQEAVAAVEAVHKQATRAAPAPSTAAGPTTAAAPLNLSSSMQSVIDSLPKLSKFDYD